MEKNRKYINMVRSYLADSFIIKVSGKFNRGDNLFNKQYGTIDYPYVKIVINLRVYIKNQLKITHSPR